MFKQCCYKGGTLRGPIFLNFSKPDLQILLYFTNYVKYLNLLDYASKSHLTIKYAKEYCSAINYSRFVCVNGKTSKMSGLSEFLTSILSVTSVTEDTMWLYVYIFTYVYIVCIIFLFIYISSTLTVCSPNTTESELYTTALSSPESNSKTVDGKSQVTVTLSSTPNSTCISPKKATLGRSESRKQNRKSFYELSPDISDRHVQLLEKNYGGKERANRAARIIQQHYRSWTMKRTYRRLRSQSEARRTSMKGHLSKRNSRRSPSSSDSMSPTGPIPLNLNLNFSESENSNEPMLKSPESENQQRQHSAKDEFKPIQADINIDSNFGQVNTCQPDLSVRRVSEDISSIEISKNLLNDSIGQKMIIDEVFQQILSPRKDSISLSGRSDSFRSKRNENMSIPEESVAVTETVADLEGVPKDTEGVPKDTEGVPKDTEGVDGIDGVDTVDGTKQTGGTEGAMVNNAIVQINIETEQNEMVPDERPTQDEMINSNDNLPVKEERGM